MPNGTQLNALNQPQSYEEYARQYFQQNQPTFAPGSVFRYNGAQNRNEVAMPDGQGGFRLYPIPTQQQAQRDNEMFFAQGQNMNDPRSSFGPSGFTAYDQYNDLQQRYPGFQLGRGDGGFQTAVRGQQITQFGRPISEDPRFADVLSPLFREYTAPNVFANGDPSQAGAGTFERGIGTLGLGRGMSPEIQNVLNTIQQLQSRATGNAASNAQALASRRGLAGSSIEQFGVGSAIGEAQRPFTEQQANVLLSEAQRQQQLRDLQARALFDRSGIENQANLQRAQIEGGLAGQFAGLDLQRRSQAASLTSDELASLRNLREAGQNRLLQRDLGDQARNQAIWAADVARTAQERANRGGFMRAFAPALAGGLGSAIGGPIGGALFGNLSSGLFNRGGGGGYSTGYSPQFGQVGTGSY